MVTYKLGDNMATALATPFYLDLGFTLTEIGLVAKHAALWPAIAGGLFGGIIMLLTRHQPRTVDLWCRANDQHSWLCRAGEQWAKALAAGRGHRI